MIVTCKQVSLAYEKRLVLSDLSFTVEEGDYLAVIGENGAGKSTLLKGILGLLKPVSGEILLGISGNQIGYLPQQTLLQQHFPASVEEVVLSGRLNRRGWSPFYTKKDKQAAEGTMERLEILDLKKRCYRELSGGQQQRVLLARALCSASQLLLLDEPTAGLDTLATEEFYRLIGELNREGMTVMMVSHDIPATLRYANRVLRLEQDGIFFGRTEDYKGGGTL